MSSKIFWKPTIELTPIQKKIDESQARFKFVKAGRRGGKTKYGVYWQTKQAIKTPGVNHWYITPTQNMAHEIAWDEYIQQLGPKLIDRAYERALTIHLVNGSKIYLKGSDKIDDSLRGRHLGSVVFDEAAYHKSHVWQRIVRPMLADLRAPALFISSPKKSWFSKEWESAKSGATADSAAWHYTIYDNPYIDRAEISQIRANTPEDVWQQEYMANEIEYCGKVYMEFDSKSIFSPAEAFQGHTKNECVLGGDWGLLDPSAFAWLHVQPNGLVIVSAEHVKANWDPAKHCDILKQKSKGRDIKPGNMALDSSAFRRESNGQSVADQFKKEGFTFYKADRDPDAGINLVKQYLRGNGTGPWLYISGACREAIAAFNDWEYGEHEPDILAAIRYGLQHAVRKRLTNLTSPGIILRPIENEMNSCEKLPIRKKSSQWSFDIDSGVPT